MGLLRNMVRWGGARTARRMSRSVPLVGGMLAVGILGSAIRRKGWFKGALDTALNATPFVGGVKLSIETLRGRDLIADQRRVGKPA